VFGTVHLGVFVASGLLLNVTPGQDTFYIIGRSVSQGRRAGVLSVAGIVTGCAVHTCAAALGLSAILAASARAFTVVKLAGAAYLVYLGIRMLMSRAVVPGSSGHMTPESDWRIYRDGLFCNLLNPKTALFFLAFLPQFISPTSASRIGSFLFLGAVFIFNGTLWCLVLAWAAAGMSRQLRENSWSFTLINRAAGTMFIILGAVLAAAAE
jgi:threonine/homoserine/homoserine lactone efflux protein